MEEQELQQFEAALAEDPNIQAAVAEHNAACENDDEANCIVCNTKKALSQLMYVSQALEHSKQCDDEDCGELTELEVADSMINDLETALYVISACQTGIQLLSGVSQAAAFIIHANEGADDYFDDEDEDDDDE